MEPPPRMKQSVRDRLMASFHAHTGAWILAVLAAWSVFSHYRTGARFERACVHAQAVLERISVAAVRSDHNARSLQDICEDRLADPEMQD